MKFLLQHYFQDNFKSSGSSIAIEHGDKKYTYSDIEKLSEVIAGEFSSAGLRKGDKLVILSQVSPQIIACMIACLRLGIIYVPLNVFAPADWLANVVRKCQTSHIVYDEKFSEVCDSLKSKIDFSLSYTIESNGAIVDSKKHDISKGCKQAIIYPDLLADDLAYILFTSGSTGDPKGIMLSHRNAYTFTEWMRIFFNVIPQDRVFSRAPLQFDLSVFDIFTTFSATATLVIVPSNFSEEAADIVEYMRDKAVTIIYTVPSAYIRLLNKGNLIKNISSLRLALYAGEPFSTPYLRRVMQALPDTNFWNIYGPTETNIVTYYHIKEIPVNDDPIPIGKAVFDTELFIADENLALVPDGEIGEILVRGGTIFRGYLNNAQLSAERLVQCDWFPYPEKFCRTGDLGRILPDGNIQYHGRKDNMVKTRGYRVEIDEVELALSSINGIAQAAVVAVSDVKYTNTLHAFVQLTSSTMAIESIKSLLEGKLPSYMIPFTFRVVDDFPKTSTAKIDRVRLRQIIENEKSAA